MIQTLYKIGKAIENDLAYEEYFQPWGKPFQGRENEAKVLITEIENGSVVNCFQNFIFIRNSQESPT